MNIPELLAPAGNPERLRTAFHFGADAAYLGMQKMSLRNFAENFSLDDLYEAVRFAHSMQRKVYVTVNAFLRNADIKALPAFLRDIAQTGVDALIVNDPGTIVTAREFAPELALHLSTQANTMNARAAAFWHMQGIKRIVLARELSLAEISDIRRETPESLEYEIFVHGAMCVSYSGRCLLSNYISGRDSNKGECAQPCRWTYEMRERGQNGEYLPIEQDAQGTYILNARDMNLISHLEEICALGVHSIKIEGRMKSIYYVACVINAYRMALDAIKAGMEYKLVLKPLERELEKISHRPYTSGFAFGNPEGEGQATNHAGYTSTHTLSAVALSYNSEKREALLEQRNRFFEGDTLEALSPGDISKSIVVRNMRTEEGERVDAAPHPKQRLIIDTDIALKPGDILRKEN